MSATQQVDKITFGTVRAYGLAAGAISQFPYGNVNEASLDIKTDLKEIYSEQAYPIQVFDGQRSVDLSFKHYTDNLAVMATDQGLGTTPIASSYAVAYDEVGTFSLAAGLYTLANATIDSTSLDLKVGQPIAGGQTYPLTYTIVAAGSEVAGVSASVTGNVVKCATGDKGLGLVVTYKYTNTAGKMLTILGGYQNQSASFKFRMYKRDISPIDSSVGILICELNAVRIGGVKRQWKTNDADLLERTGKAFADPNGIVGTFTFINV